MEKKKCYVLGCPTIGGKLFRIPINKSRADTWKKFCRNPVMEDYPLEMLHNSFQICSKHFHIDAFTYPTSEKLLRSAVPTLLPPIRDTPENLIDVAVLSSSPEPQPSTSHDDEPILSNTESPQASTSSLGSVSSTVLIASTPSTALTSSDSPPLTSSIIPSESLLETPKRRFKKTSALHSIGMTRLEHLTPRKRLLMEKLNKSKKEIGRMKRICLQYKKDLHGIGDLTNSSLMRHFEKQLSPSALLLVTSIIEKDQKKPKGRRWSNTEKMMALSLFKKGPKSYRFFRTFIPLPAKSTLTSLLKSIPLKTGLNEEVYAHLSSAVKNFESDKDRCCALLFDEMSIRSHLTYDSTMDEIWGYVDQGSHGRSGILAKQALVFMVRGLRVKWKQPLTFYPSHGSTPAATLAELIKENLVALRKIGLKVVVAICDMGTSNVKALQLLGADFCNPYFHFEGARISTVFDPPHLLKSFRNLFMKHNIRVPVTLSGEQVPLVATWEHLRVLAKDDASIKYLPLRLFNLTEKHLAPSSFEKMRVNLATKVFSRHVAAGVHALVGRNVLGLDGLATAEFLMEIDMLFDSMNGSNTEQNSTKKMKQAVTPHSSHVKFWQEMEEKVKSWKFLRKSVIHPPSQDGWIASIKGITMLWERLYKEGFLQLNTQNVNQDPLENFFNVIRQNCGGNHFPNAFQFHSAFKTALLNNLLSNHTPGNTKEDGCTLLSNLSTYFFSERDDVIPAPEMHCKSMKKFLTLADNKIASVVKVSYHFADNFVKEYSCSDCKLSLFNEVSTAEDIFFSFMMEDLGGFEVYPSEKLVSAVGSAIDAVKSVLKKEGHKCSILLIVRPVVEMSLNLNFLHCIKHQNEFRNDFIMFISLVGIRAFCIEENKMNAK